MARERVIPECLMNGPQYLNEMLRYLKENGFPLNLEFETTPFHDEENDFHGWKSKVYIDENLFTEFCHSNYRDRVHWANGFFAAYKWESEGKYKWRDKKDQYRQDGKLNIEVGDWIVDINEKVRRVERDSQEDLTHEDIVRHATEIEVENAALINKLADKLAEIKRSNRSCWDSYGSELCAGEMIREEENIEKKIEKLRNEIR